jgi:hypothetical protein
MSHMAMLQPVKEDFNVEIRMSSVKSFLALE